MYSLIFQMLRSSLNVVYLKRVSYSLESDILLLCRKQLE